MRSTFVFTYPCTPATLTTHLVLPSPFIHNLIVYFMWTLPSPPPYCCPWPQLQPRQRPLPSLYLCFLCSYLIATIHYEHYLLLSPLFKVHIYLLALLISLCVAFFAPLLSDLIAPPWTTSFLSTFLHSVPLQSNLLIPLSSAFSDILAPYPLC